MKKVRAFITRQVNEIAEITVTDDGEIVEIEKVIENFSWKNGKILEVVETIEEYYHDAHYAKIAAATRNERY